MVLMNTAIGKKAFSTPFAVHKGDGDQNGGQIANDKTRDAFIQCWPEIPHQQWKFAHRNSAATSLGAGARYRLELQRSAHQVARLQSVRQPCRREWATFMKRSLNRGEGAVVLLCLFIQGEIDGCHQHSSSRARSSLQYLLNLGGFANLDFSRRGQIDIDDLFDPSGMGLKHQHLLSQKYGLGNRMGDKQNCGSRSPARFPAIACSKGRVSFRPERRTARPSKAILAGTPGHGPDGNAFAAFPLTIHGAGRFSRPFRPTISNNSIGVRSPAGIVTPPFATDLQRQLNIAEGRSPRQQGWHLETQRAISRASRASSVDLPNMTALPAAAGIRSETRAQHGGFTTARRSQDRPRILRPEMSSVIFDRAVSSPKRTDAPCREAAAKSDSAAGVCRAAMFDQPSLGRVSAGRIQNVERHDIFQFWCAAFELTQAVIGIDLALPVLLGHHTPATSGCFFR